MSDYLYMPKQLTITNNNIRDLGGAVRIGIQANPDKHFVLNVETTEGQNYGNRKIAIGKTGLYYLDLTGGLGLITNIKFIDLENDESAIIDYLVADTGVQEGVQITL